MSVKVDLSIEKLKIIALALNAKADTITTDDFLKENYGISRKTWSRKIKETPIVYNSELKKYVFDEKEDLSIAIKDIETNTVNVGHDSNNNDSIESSTKSIEHKKLKTHKTVGRPEKEETKDYIRKTFIITKEQERAIKLKAINEGVGYNELVREILNNAIESKYFKKL